MSSGSAMTMGRGAPRPTAADDLRAQHRRQVRRERGIAVALGIATPLLGLAIWQILVMLGVIASVYFPEPTKVVQQMAQDLTASGQTSVLFSDLWLTIKVTLLAFMIGGGTGLAVGLMMGALRPVRYALAPTLYATLPAPKIVLYPLFIVIFGLGQTSIMLLAALGAFYMVCITTLGGMLAQRQIYDDVARVFLIPRGRRIRTVMIPAVWPSIMNGLRLGLGAALIVVLILEFIGSTTGMGAYIWNAWQAGQTGEMFGGLLIVAIVGGLLFVGGNALERLAKRW